MWWRGYPRLIYKESKIDYISGSAACNVLRFVFIVCQSRGLQNILKLRC